jgi:hypothetical protein
VVRRLGIGEAVRAGNRCVGLASARCSYRCDNRGVAGDLRIWVIGGFRAEVGGRPVAEDAWRRSGASALVKLLAVTPGHRMHREQLIDVLWPDLDRRQVPGG